MGTLYDTIDPQLVDFIGRQQMFFVATAAHVLADPRMTLTSAFHAEFGDTGLGA